MGLSVKLDLPQYPEDAVLGVAGLGAVENGGTLDVTPEMEQSFISEQGGRTVAEGFEGQDGVTVTGKGTVEAPPKPQEPPQGEPQSEPPAPEPQPTTEQE
jgi:hypothetical protein